ncbi:MAG: hypothetical protein VX549_15330 [Pseudomonadota bacterium]|nr:hypothetical protein [Pseudomonadota bacterium]
MTETVHADPVETALESRVVILGDSHVRAFSTQAAAIPVFLGPGKRLNFLSGANAESTRTSIARAIQRCPATSQPVLLYGEAVCRYLLGRGWHLRGETDACHSNNAEAVLLREAEQLVGLLESLAECHDRSIDLLLPPATLRARQTGLHRRFNRYASKVSSHRRVRLLDPFEMGEWHQTGPRDWYIDAIHCGDRFATMAMQNFWSDRPWPTAPGCRDLWPLELTGFDWLEPDPLFRCYRPRDGKGRQRQGLRGRFVRRLRRAFRAD